MAVSASALTLAQYAIMSNDPLVQRITMSLIDAGNILQDIPIVDKSSLTAMGVRWEGSLPTVSWQALNTEPTVTSGTPTPFMEQAYIVRNAIDVDRVLVEDENQIVDPRGAQIDAYLESFTRTFNDIFINNTQSTGDINAPVGIRARLDNATQYGVRSANKIDAGAIDLSQSGATAAIANKFLEFLDQLLWSTGSIEGNDVILYMNEVMFRRLAFVVRLAGPGAGFETTVDSFGRLVQTYRGAIIRDVGYKSDQATRVITTTEGTTGLDSSSTYTSIYAVRASVDYLFGWQFRSIGESVMDVGLIGNAGTIYRTVIDYVIGLMTRHTRSIARLYGIKLA